MATVRHPRHGSLQYWPRKRAQRQHARVRTWKSEKDGLQGFAGYKAGMTHISVTDNRKHSITKGQDISMPVTIIECPPLKIIGARLYEKAKKGYGVSAATEIHTKAGKHINRTTDWKETGELDTINPKEYTHATIIVQTQPEQTRIGQKKPQIFEIGYEGSVEQTIAYAKEKKEISVADVFKTGEFTDVHAVSRGKGTQGPVKRFGISLRSHKSEKSRRRGVLGGEGNAKVTYRAVQAGKMGYHLRTENNKQIMAIISPEEIQVRGGIVNYGQVKNTTILLKGGVPGPKKRLITIAHAARPDKKKEEKEMALVEVATRSQQGHQ